MEVRLQYILGFLLAVCLLGFLYLTVPYINTKFLPASYSFRQPDLCQTLLEEFKSIRPTASTTPLVTEWWQAAALIYWYIVSPVEYECQHEVSVGNWLLCQDQPYTVKPPCLVYSFGIARDFSFDDAMGKLSCEVHSFDPSMNVSDHRRNQNVTFHTTGISGIDSNNFQARKDSYVKTSQLWKMRTLKTIMKELGHENRALDVLKIDVEGHEWAVVKNIMDDGLFPKIRQFYLEWHLFPDWPAKSTYVKLYELYTKLRTSGLLGFRKSPHPYTFNPDRFNIQGDVNYVNKNFTGLLLLKGCVCATA